MDTFTSSPTWRRLLAVAAAALACAATLPLALRVELEPLRASGSGTEVVVMIQVAPEDRARVGASAWVEVELRDGSHTLDRLARTVQVDRQGRARLEATWPAGEHELRVEVRSGSGDARGFWLDRVNVPALAPPPAESAVTPAPSPAPAAVLAPSPTVPTAPPPMPAATPRPTPPPAVPVEQGAPPDLVELTITVTRAGRPVLGLTPEQLRLRVDGRELTDKELAGAGQTPVGLAVALDLSATVAPYLEELRRQVGALAMRVDGGGGRVCLVTADAEARLAADWGAPPERLVEALAAPGQAAAGDLAGLVNAALSALERVRGRKLLVVVSDGGDTSRAEGWSRASAAAAAAGVPFLVVGLPGLDGRAERALDRLVAESGGESFQATTTDVLAAVLHHYGELLDGAYALRFRRPLPARGQLVRVEVEPALEGNQVRCPRRVR